MYADFWPLISGRCVRGLGGCARSTVPPMNPITKSSHIMYVLDKPVVMTDAARRKPVNLLDRIERALGDGFVAERTSRD